MLTPVRFAMVALVASGCRATISAFALDVPPPPPACDDQKVQVGLRDLDLGFALYGTVASPLNASQPGLGQLLREASHDLVLEVVAPALAVPPGALELKYGDLAGVPPCEVSSSWVQVTGRPARALVQPQTPLARERLDTADRLSRTNRDAEARVAYASAGAGFGDGAPVFQLRIANTYLQEQRFAEALARFSELAIRFPWNADVWTGQGASLRGLKRSLEAGSVMGRALALNPGRDSILAYLRTIPRMEVVDSVRPPARRWVGPGGVTWRAYRHPGVPDRLVRAEARSYAACKDAFRRSAALRKAVSTFDLPLWRWTPAEETVCTSLWVSTYHQHRSEGRIADQGLDNLVEIFQAGFADERALFDIGGRAHPLAPALLDPVGRERLFAFVTQFRVRPRAGTNVFFP